MPIGSREYQDHQTSRGPYRTSSGALRRRQFDTLRGTVDIEAGAAEEADQGLVEATGEIDGEGAGGGDGADDGDAGNDGFLHDFEAAPAGDHENGVAQRETLFEKCPA